MQLGICAEPKLAGMIREAGFVFYDWSVPGFLRPLDSEEVFLETLDKVKKSELPLLACNCFLPGSMNITGPEADMKALEKYVITTCERAKIAGLKFIIFGSGGARRCPEGYEMKKAYAEVVDFCHMIGPIAKDNNVTIAIEPLQSSETNIVNTVEDGAKMVEIVDHPNVRLLADYFHMGRMEEDVNNVTKFCELIVHCHLATFTNRRPPGQEPQDFQPFFNALKAGGYKGGISIEAHLEEPERDIFAAFSVLNECLKKC